MSNIRVHMPFPVANIGIEFSLYPRRQGHKASPWSCGKKCYMKNAGASSHSDDCAEK
jgi:hypothetical protein